ncbi:PREDICTED: A-kinase anchor protein 9-like [Camelina sativa]|uniref:FRIGIDA-like protein n=1 Tax=Camelina sativa TaxID=90675 RepID=A0ABM0T679_CAMSA|nr:PREDICTED: A-kinase anchor protein 9-like [Camelina sativa]
MEKSSYEEELTESKRQYLHKSVEKLKADASEIIAYSRRLKGLRKHFETVEDNINRRSGELEFKEKQLQISSLDLDKKSQSFEAEKSKAGDLKKLVEECTEELRSKRNQLSEKQNSSARIQGEIEVRSKQLKQVKSEHVRLCNEVLNIEDRKREVKEETARKAEYLSLILDKIEESSKQLASVDEQLDSQQRRLATRSMELVSTEKKLGCLRESIELSNSDLQLKENKIQLLNNIITDCSKRIDSKSQEVEERQKLIEKQTDELAVLQNQHDTIKQLIQALSEELVAKEKTHKEILETICRSSSEMEVRAKKIRAAEAEATDLNVRSEWFRKEVTGKEKELDLLKNQHDTVKQLIQVLSEELVAKEKTHKEILETICRSSSEMEARAKEIKAAEAEATDLNVRSERFRKEVKGKEKELDLLKNQIESEKKKHIQLTREMEEETDRKKRVLGLTLDKIEGSGKQLATVDAQLVSRRKLLKIRSVELFSAKKKLGYVRKSIKQSISVLERKETMIHTLNNKLSAIDSKSEELEEIIKLIEKHTNELVVLRNQRDSIWQLIQGLSEEFVAKEMELECVVESNNHFKFEIEVNEKRVQSLNSLITISGEQLDMKSKELEEIQRELELSKKRLRNMSTVLVKKEKQAAAAETAPVNEYALTHHEIPAATLSRHEVSSVLRDLPNPAEFVLVELQDHLNVELGFQDAVLRILILSFEELTKIQRPDDPQLQNKATQVATLWKGMIAIEAQKSSLEVLAFLLFIVAYGLKNLINEEEAALLASSIAHYEQAPRLFKSLSLNTEIRKFVKELIKKNQYIPAVRLICLFKLNGELSPSHLLRKEIINLRRSALESRPAESSQAKDKDAGRLRAILELVADYKLEINLPGDLIAKLMIERENAAPQVRCYVEHATSSLNPQAASPNPVSAQRSLNPASAQSSSVNLQVPKPEVKPYLN